MRGGVFVYDFCKNLKNVLINIRLCKFFRNIQIARVGSAVEQQLPGKAY